MYKYLHKSDLHTEQGLAKPLNLQAYSPAEAAGLKEWDYVWSINGQEVFEMSHNQICNIIKGAGTSIEMVVER